MSGLASLLLFAAFFYLMMRFGCGSHMVHGHRGHGDHQGHGDHEMEAGGGMAGVGMKAKDPVCGMEVDPRQGYTETYQGRRYQFCSRKCLDEFDENPQRYAQAAAPADPTAHHSAGSH